MSYALCAGWTIELLSWGMNSTWVHGKLTYRKCKGKFFLSSYSPNRVIRIRVQVSMNNKFRVMIRAAAICFILLICAHGHRSVAHAQQESASGQAPLVLRAEQDEYLLGPYVYLLEDPNGNLTIDDVTSPEISAQFTPSNAKIPNFGFTSSTYWVRLALYNQSSVPVRWTLEVEFPSLHYIDLYSPLPESEAFAVKQAGAYRPLTDDDIRHLHPAFELNLPPASERVYYLRLQSSSSMTMPLTLRNPDAFQSHAQTQLVVTSLFLGALLSLLTYNGILCFVVREKTYIYLVALLANLIIFEAVYSGFARVYLVAEPYMLYRYLLPLTITIILALFIPFTVAYLNLKQRAPRLYRVNITGFIVWVIVVLLLPVTSYRDYASVGLLYALLTTSILLGTTLIGWFRGMIRSSFFMVAWYGMLVAFCVTIMVRIGILPSSLLTEHAYELGAIVMAVCWSVALADQIRLLKSDVEKNAQNLSSILDGLPVGVAVYGKDRLPTYINRRANEILANPTQGIEPDLSKRRSLDEIMHYYSFRVQGTEKPYSLANVPVDRALKGETSVVDDMEADLVDRRVPLEVMASPVFDTVGNVASAVVAFQDISERRKRETELQYYRLHLEELVTQRTTELFKLNRWLGLVNELYDALNSMTRVSQAHERLLTEMSRLTGAHSILLAISGEQVEQVAAICLRQDGSNQIVEQRTLRMGPNSAVRKMIDQNDLLILAGESERVAHLQLDFCQSIDEPSSVVLAPISTRYGATGCLILWMSRPTKSFVQEEISLYERIGADLGKMADYQHLNDEIRKVGAAEERSRLARDLHDSVTQVLFSASILADVLPKTYQSEPAQAGATIESLRLLIRGALAEMRTLLLELRPITVVKTPLHNIVSQLAEAISIRSNLSLRLLIEQVPVLPEEVHMGFYRIAQEALNNVVKHARASHVDVQLNANLPDSEHEITAKHAVKLMVRDNGIGFAPENQAAGGMGLSIMRERAREMGADLALTSQVGAGTTVTLIWPGGLEQSNQVD